METEAQCYSRLRDELAARVERRMDELERQDDLDAADDIELTALDALLEDVRGLEY
jgi:hypothetical protein